MVPVPVPVPVPVVVPAALYASAVPSSSVPSGIVTLMAAMLDRVECGLVAVAADATLLHANRAARAELANAGVLALHGRHVVAPRARDAWSHLLSEAAVRRRSRLLQLDSDGSRLMLVATPGPADDAPGTALVLFGRREACSRLGLEMLAHHHGLTSAEARVLTGLLQRQSPRQVADDHGVAVSTIRTQIRALCEKLGVRGIDGLLLRAAEVPPVMAAC